MHVFVHACGHTCVSVGQRATLGVIPLVLSTLFHCLGLIKQDRLACHQAQGVTCLHFLDNGITNMATTHGVITFFFKTGSHHITSNISSVFLIVFCLHSLFFSVVVFIFVVFLLFIFSAIITSLYFYSFCYSLLIFIYFFFTIGQYFFFSLVAVSFCRHASFFPYSLLSVYSEFYI